MNLGELREEYGDFYVPRFTVTVTAGDVKQAFDESDGVISDLSVETTLSGANTFSATLNYPFDLEAGEFDGLDWELFRAGSTVDVEIGYDDERTPLFLGRITALSPNFPADGGPTVDISGYGLLHALTGKTHSETWTDETVPAVAEAVINREPDRYGFRTVEIVGRDPSGDEKGLSPEEGPGPEYEEIKQDEHHGNDLRFLLTLATDYGFELFARHDAFYFRRPKFDADPVITLRYGESLSSFSPQVNTADQVSQVQVRYYDQIRKEPIVATAERGVPSAAGRRTARTVIRTPVRSPQEATVRAEAAMENTREELVQGTGETVGLPLIQPGETIELEGLGPAFSKTYYVSNATHRVGSVGYTTSFRVRRREP